MESAPQEFQSECIMPLQNTSSAKSDVLGATSLHGACNTTNESGSDASGLPGASSHASCTTYPILKGLISDGIPASCVSSSASHHGSSNISSSLEVTSLKRESSPQSEAIDSQYTIHLPDVHAANDWRQQKRRFLQQHHHLTEASSSDILLDQEFAVHLLNIHLKFCIQPSCRFGLVDGHIPAKSEYNDHMHLAQSNNSGVVQEGTVRDHIRPQFSTCMTTAPILNVESPADEKPHMNTTSSLMRTPSNKQAEDQEDSSDGWIHEQESPDMSRDHGNDTIAMEIKIEKEDTVDEGAQGVASGTWISRDVSSDVSHDYAIDGMTKQIKTEEDEASEVLGRSGHFPGERQRKCGLVSETKCRIVLKKLDIKRIPVKCHSCCKALRGNRFKYILNSQDEICPDKCDACLKQVSCTKLQTGQATSPQVAIPTGYGLGYSVADKMRTSFFDTSEEPGRECHDSGEYHEGSAKQLNQTINRAVIGLLANDNLSLRTEINHGKDSTQPIPLISRLQSRSYKCDWCSKAYNTVRILKRHIKTHIGGRPHKCTLCSKAFREKYHLQLHMTTHSEERPCKCNHCPKAFKVRHQLLRHKRTHTGEPKKRPYKCNLCPEGFFDNHHLIKHMKTHTRRKPFKCHLCSKAFRWKQGLHRHVQAHSAEGRFKCNFCSEISTTEKLLQRHMRRHTEERPYKCTICSEGFWCKRNLEFHSKEHFKDDRFKCTVCLKTFMKKAVLCVHMRSHIGGKLFECEDCLKQFCDERNFRRHLRIHSGEKNFKCNMCTKAFYRTDNLKRHMQSHRGLKNI